MPHILIVDDDTIISSLLKMTFEMHGYAVSVANNGHEALPMLNRTSFDLVLLDLVMPEMDGIVFLRNLQARGVKQPPIIIISSSIDSEIPNQLRELGVADVVRKPVEPADLVDRARAALDQAD